VTRPTVDVVTLCSRPVEHEECPTSLNVGIEIVRGGMWLEGNVRMPARSIAWMSTPY